MKETNPPPMAMQAHPCVRGRMIHRWIGSRCEYCDVPRSLVEDARHTRNAWTTKHPVGRKKRESREDVERSRDGLAALLRDVINEGHAGHADGCLAKHGVPDECECGWEKLQGEIDTALGKEPAHD